MSDQHQSVIQLSVTDDDNRAADDGDIDAIDDGDSEDDAVDDVDRGDDGNSDDDYGERDDDVNGESLYIDGIFTMDSNGKIVAQ